MNGNYTSRKANFLMTAGMLSTGAKIVKLAVLGLFATDVLIAANVKNKAIFMKKISRFNSLNLKENHAESWTYVYFFVKKST